jgi:lipoate-protein ligase B
MLNGVHGFAPPLMLVELDPVRLQKTKPCGCENQRFTSMKNHFEGIRPRATHKMAA